jgi:hypothetical protein
VNIAFVSNNYLRAVGSQNPGMLLQMTAWGRSEKLIIQGLLQVKLVSGHVRVGKEMHSD